MTRRPFAIDSKTLDLLLLVGLVGLVTLTRIYRVWDWPFSGDEFYTVDDALTGDYKVPAKAGYYMITGWMFKLFGVSEWSARLPAALFGIAGVPLFYLFARNFLNRGTAAVGGLVIVFSSWHLHYSQFSRFYTAVFFFGALAFFLYFKAIESGKLATLIGALVANAFAVFFHTTAVIIGPSCVATSLIVLLWPGEWKTDAMRRVAKIHLWIAGAGALVLVPFAYQALQEWLELGQSWGYGPGSIVLQTVKYAGIPVAVTAVFGVFWLFGENRLKGILIAVPLAVTGIFLVGSSAFMSMRPDYGFYAMPVMFLAAGYYCEVVRRKLGGHPLAAHALTIVVIAGLAPEFVSHYTSRMTLDLRAPIRFIEKRYEPGDRIVSLLGDGGYYWPEQLEPEKLPGSPYRESVDWEEKLAPYLAADERVWVAVPLRRKRLARNLDKWLHAHASLVWQRQAKRYDYSFDAFQVYMAGDRD